MTYLPIVLFVITILILLTARRYGAFAAVIGFALGRLK